jgi:hypothetical protein
MVSGAFATRLRAAARIASLDSFRRMRKVSLIDLTAAHKMLESQEASPISSVVLLVSVCAMTGLFVGAAIAISSRKITSASFEIFYENVSVEDSFHSVAESMTGLL